jgi:Amt family ammonium transporter
MLIGGLGGVVCYGGVMLKSRLRYDDSLDVVGIHGFGGTWGALATGLFASKAVNPAGSDGLFFGNPGQLAVQFVSVLATIVFAFVMTLILVKVVDWLTGVRVTDEDEEKGMDITLHDETGYNY